jgi:pyridoxamine 5'-phosphate oxidase
MTIADLRKDYSRHGLLEADADRDPIRQFHTWFEQALAAELPEPNAMILSTVSTDGRPSARVVLIKGYDERGFVFFTNYDSRKGRELSAMPFAALTFFWPELERQIRIEGVVAKTTAEESDGYYQSRPRGSQLGAWASQQSEPVADRATLDHSLAEWEARYRDGPVPRPPHWGGYRLVPEVIEFWQGRPSRMHDRLEYRRAGDGWTRRRLSP